MTEEQGIPRHALRLAETLLILACCAAYFTLEVKAAPFLPRAEVVEYLSRFGYLPPVDPKIPAIISPEAFSKAIAEFQSFMGITVTDHMDNETAHLMTSPRCGVKDEIGPSTSGRSKRWAPLGEKWKKKIITYTISNYGQRLHRTDVDKEIAKAFALWSEVTDLSFSPGTVRVDIDISFEREDHGDGDPFDGPSSEDEDSNTLAHADSPEQGPTQIHFDDDEDWSINSDEGIDLLGVAVHEIGHALGLDHSTVRGSVMSALYDDQNWAELHEDDIEGIQALYGPKTEELFPEVFHLCEDPRIDTIFTSAEGRTYVFKGEHYWRLKNGEIVAGYPKLIASKWKGLPSNIDAAFTSNSKKTYFFKGSMYWRYDGEYLDGNYPRKISQGFPGIPDHIDAVILQAGGRKIYFLKGSKYWEYDLKKILHGKSTYPKSIFSRWRGLPNNLDAAFTHGGSAYFFKDGAHYRYAKDTLLRDRASLYLTRPVSSGCPSVSNEVEDWSKSYYKDLL